MKITFVIHSPHRNLKRYVNTLDGIHEVVSSILIRYGVDEKLAYDCASWCELAVDGESYNEENFDVYIGE